MKLQVRRSAPSMKLLSSQRPDEESEGRETPKTDATEAGDSRTQGWGADVPEFMISREQRVRTAARSNHAWLPTRSSGPSSASHISRPSV